MGYKSAIAVRASSRALDATLAAALRVLSLVGSETEVAPSPGVPDVSFPRRSGFHSLTSELNALWSKATPSLSASKLSSIKPRPYVWMNCTSCPRVLRVIALNGDTLVNGLKPCPPSRQVSLFHQGHAVCL